MRVDAISYAGGGVQVTAGAASAAVAIPKTASGKRARYVAVQTIGGTYAYVTFGPTSAVTASAGDFPVGSARPQIFEVAGQSYMAYLQESAGAKISLAPVEL